MFIRPSVSDPTVGHLWEDSPPTIRVCSPKVTTVSLARRADRLCPECVRAFGADVAAAFSQMEWLRYRGRPRMRHAFDPEDAVEGRDVFPICMFYRVARARLVPDEDSYRCPSCVEILRARGDRRARVPA